MGHYDDSYEHDERIRRQEHAKELKRAKKAVEKLSSDYSARHFPSRFQESLEDLNNWLTIQIGYYDGNADND